MAATFLAAIVLPAAAADGDGGIAGDSTFTSAGGSASATSAGGNGTDGINPTPGSISGGAGGGSGVTGGNGGAGAGDSAGSGGTGASNPGESGSDASGGGDGSSGGGGGGGAHAYVGDITSLPVSGSLTGGNGGNGGPAGIFAYGGGGGGGGFGAVVTSLAGAGGTITVSATGGAGGAAGYAATGGSGGSGLVIYQPTGNNVITITGSTIAGGAGGGTVDGEIYGGVRAGNGGSGLVLDGATGNTTLSISGGSITGGDAPAGTAYGGNGGTGILVQNTTGVTTLNIDTVVTGGGAATGLYQNGVAGAGIAGANLIVSIGATGSVSGGAGPNGTIGAALNFTGGSNTLTLASGATVTGGIVVADNTTTLQFAQATDATLSSVISGGGSITKTGAGTLTLTGTSTYTGGTTINAGTIAITSDAGLGAASGVLTLDGGTLSTSGTFTSTRAVVLGVGGGTLESTSGVSTFSGTISGTGGLTIGGGGSDGVVLTGTNTYTGATTVNGSLAIGYLGASGSVAGDIIVNSGGILAFARSDSYTVTNSIQSVAGSTVGFAGGGTYSYAGSGIIAGSVLVQGAELRLTGNEFASASSVSLSSGGILSGNGTVSALTVGNGGIVSPGNSPGTIATSSVSFGNGSIYRVDVTPSGAHDLITSTGAVTINNGATVQVVAQPGRYAYNTSYAILTTTGTLTGTFGSVTSDYAFLTPSLSYDAQNVYLVLRYWDGVSFATYAQTANQANTAVAAQQLGFGNAVFDALVQQTASSAPVAFNALSGEAYASVGTVIQQQAVYVREAVGSRLMQSLTAPGVSPLAYGAGPQTAALGEGLTPTLWAQGYGGWGNSFSNGNAASISNSIGGFLLGLDVALAPNVRAGLFGGFSQSQFDVTDRSSTGSMNNVDLGLYAGAQFGAFALRGGASYTWHDVSMNRTVAFPGFSQAVEGGYNTGTTQVFGEVGYDFTVGAYAFEPFAGLAYVNVAGASLQEGGGSAGLSVSTSGMDTTYSTLGLRVATTMQVWGSTLTPHAMVGWQHAFGDTTPTSTMQFLGGTTPFSVSGVPIAEDAVLLQAGLTYALSPKASLGASYTSQLASTAAQNAFTAQFSLRF